jgi:hypothetical protein
VTQFTNPADYYYNKWRDSLDRISTMKDALWDIEALTLEYVDDETVRSEIGRIVAHVLAVNTSAERVHIS